MGWVESVANDRVSSGVQSPISTNVVRSPRGAGESNFEEEGAVKVGYMMKTGKTGTSAIGGSDGLPLGMNTHLPAPQ